TECINGDQGILIEKSFWKKSGKFDETLPFLEDRSFATVVENKGSWLLLSPTIFTSSRRFFQEGLHQRQTLNSIIRNFHSAERTDFISALPEIYKNQDKTQKLKLNPFFRKIRSLFSELAVREQCRLWYQTGSYIAGNAWQIAFFLDIKKEFKNGGVRGRRRLLKFHEIFIQKVVSSPPAALITTCLVWGWFHFHYFNKKR
ncbi:MAG: glycosyl transferase, partial [Nitrospinota bacterium]